MSQTVGDFFWHRMHEWGVHTIFGYPGDGINGLLGALNRAEDEFEFIQARHEEMAAFMASAYAKFTGEVGVCIATSGPGRLASDHRALRRANGPHAGAGDHRPAGPHGDRRSLPAGTRPAAYVQGRGRRLRLSGECAGAGASPGRSRDAHRAKAGVASPRWCSRTTCRRRSYLSRRARMARCIPASATRAPMVVPHAADLRRAAEVLNAGKKVAILVGAGRAACHG